MKSLARAAWRWLRRGLAELWWALAAVLLGGLALVVWLLPWAFRLLATAAWLIGMYLAGDGIRQVYGPVSDSRAVLTLWALPAVLGATLPVVMARKKMLERIWGAMWLFGLACWGVWRWFPGWAADSPTLVMALPALGVISMTLFLAPRLRLELKKNDREGGGASRD